MTAITTASEALRRLNLFAELPEVQLATLAGTALYETYDRGEVLFHSGDPGDRAYVIQSGAIDLVIESANGRELILSRLEAGEHFGEMALVDDRDRSATARAAEPTKVVVVLRRAFIQALEDEPEMSREIIRSLVQRLRTADEKLEAFAYLDVKGRIARTILELDRGQGKIIHVSHEELSNMAATSRQTATRVLDEWEDAGWIDLVRRGLRATDVDALTAVAEL